MNKLGLAVDGFLAGVGLGVVYLCLPFEALPLGFRSIAERGAEYVRDSWAPNSVPTAERILEAFFILLFCGVLGAGMGLASGALLSMRRRHRI